MDETTMNVCAICGEERSANDIWFLLAENRWEDKLRVLHWTDRLAAHNGIQPVCSPAHVRELVVHWMTTGSLDYPFARTSFWAGPARRYGRTRAAKSVADISAVQQIGELAVHRESMERVLVESPQSLEAILDALLEGLRHATAATEAGAQSKDVEFCALAPEV
jgi:hypothetical protein